VTAFLDSLRRGSWVTPDRARIAAIAATVATIATFGVLIVSGQGTLGGAGGPPGTDFASFYAAGKAALAGAPGSPYDPAAHYAREQALFGAETPFFAWQYPPVFLLVAAPLAMLPYLAALLVWQTVSLLLYLAAILAILRSGPAAGAAQTGSVTQLALLFAVGYPAVFVNLGHGQNGFLSAALIGGGLAILDRRPMLAGALFGLLAYKPQLGLMIPVALLAGGRWRACGAAVLVVAALVVLAGVAFGTDVWQTFLASTGYSRSALLEGGGVAWHKFQTVYAAVRMWGGTLDLAYAAQALTTLATAIALAWLWRGRAAYPVMAAALALGTILATPFAFDYDLMVVAPAIAFLTLDAMARGAGPYEKTAAALLWLVPLVARSIAGALSVPIGILTVAAVFALTIRRGARDGASG
jgi:alpha-1,2-mannosyltransferase